jgi:hypothetical protein
VGVFAKRARPARLLEVWRGAESETEKEDRTKKGEKPRTFPAARAGACPRREAEGKETPREGVRGWRGKATGHRGNRA